jgi:hypothetical protein
MLRLKRKELIAPRHQDPRQFPKHIIQPIRRCIDDRVPANGAGERSRINGKCVELALYEVDVRVCGASGSKHRLGHVHADHVETVIRHEGRYSARSAANIGNAGEGLLSDQLDEGYEERPVKGEFCGRADMSAHELDIRLCRPVVDISGGGYMVLTRHASRLCNPRPR